MLTLTITLGVAAGIFLAMAIAALHQRDRLRDRSAGRDLQHRVERDKERERGKEEGKGLGRHEGRQELAEEIRDTSIEKIDHALEQVVQRRVALDELLAADAISAEVCAERHAALAAEEQRLVQDAVDAKSLCAARSFVPRPLGHWFP